MSTLLGRALSSVAASPGFRRASLPNLASLGVAIRRNYHERVSGVGTKASFF